MIWYTSKWFLFPLPCQKQEENFLQYLLWGGPPSMTRFPWSFYLTDLCKLTLKYFIPCSSGFPILAWVPVEIFAPQFLFWCVLILCICLCFFPIWGSAICLWCCSSDWPKKSFWGFSLLSFLLVGMEWWLLSSVWAELETISHHMFVIYSFLFCTEILIFKFVSSNLRVWVSYASTSII